MATGNQVEGSRFTWAAASAATAPSAANCASTKSPPTELGDYIERVVRNFISSANEGERFAQWAVRAEEGDLR